MAWRALLVVIAVAPSATAADLTAARERLQRGNLAEARPLFEALPPSPARTLGLCRVEEESGELDAALARLTQAVAETPADAALHARLAELLYDRGRWDDADAVVATALKLDADQMLARFVRANVLRDRGKLDQADGEFRWFVRYYVARNRARADIKEPEQLLIVGQAGSENARWHNLADQFQFILNEVYGDALRADKLFWQAEYHAGLLLAEKYNRSEAAKAFDKALAINPRAAPALVGKGYLALGAYELKDAERLADRALAINPRLISALHLAADVAFASGETTAAMKHLAAAKQVNPRDAETLGRLAACALVQKDAAAFAAGEADATSNNPKPASFYGTVADRLEDRRIYGEAEKYYQKAIGLWPALPGAKTSLGMLHLRTGKEAEGTAMLAEAFESDRFNVRVANSLKVMRHMEAYESIRTPHFIVRFDKKLDAALGRYAAEFCEREYDRLAAKFDYRPAGPLLVEVFNSHEMFSGRTVAMPDLHTIGASTGPLVAMVSPRGKGVRKVFNWGRVLRHELVHVFNLTQTDYQCPHWLTEGLAVSQEGFPRPPDWLRLLAERLAKNELFDLGSIDLGFIRPRSPRDWTLAYCQGNLYVEYLQKFHGQASIAGLLAAYRDGLSTAAAIQKVCGTDVPTFETGYLQFVRQLVERERGRPLEVAMTLPQLRDAVDKNPADAELLARLGEQLAKRKRMEEAGQLADRALEAKPGFGYALFVKAMVLRANGDEDAATTLLEAAASALPPDPRVVRLLGRMHFDAGEADKAYGLFERGRALEPGESSWLEDMAKASKLLGDPSKRIAALAALAPTDADDLETRKELAKLLLDAGRFAEAERWAREALEIDIQDAVVRKLFLEALERQGKADALAKVRKLLEG